MRYQTPELASIGGLNVFDVQTVYQHRIANSRLHMPRAIPPEFDFHEGRDLAVWGERELSQLYQLRVQVYPAELGRL